MPTTYLPAILGGSPDIVAQDDTCGMDINETTIMLSMSTHPEQKRDVILCHAVLVQVARAKALDLAMRGYEAHVDLDGHGANWLLRQAGYRLPDYYGQHDSANNVESCGWGGDGTPEQIWSNWLGSEGHRTHLLGLNDTHRPQTMVGVGHVYRQESRQGHYWVVITCVPEA